ncbi:hypothetical protein ACAW74_05585 [Fibrella sp. WM1]|uniref:hypothetical protein n=1 Tax=Fibrella musci TaxID=3242485 RepID=UPI00351FAD42
MTLDIKRILGRSTLLLLIATYLTQCNGNFFYIWRTGKQHEFTVKQTRYQPVSDSSPVVEITGELDGNAVVFIPNGSPDSTGFPTWPGNYSPSYDSYVVSLQKGKVDKKIHTEMRRDFKLIYRPITAKSGSLNIKVNY